jgi:hypothetical protein
MVWNSLGDEATSPKDVVSSLASWSAELIIGSEAIYEMARTFQ